MPTPTPADTPIAQGIATVNPAGTPPFVQVFDCANNSGVFTLSLHDGTTGATLSILAENVNSFSTPQVRYVLPLPAAQLAGKILVCRVTLIPAGQIQPLGFTLNVVQDDQIIDDGNARLSIASSQPENAGIRVELQ
jgi:hypothetical protein